MKIEYDNIYCQWVVWAVESNTMKEIFKSNLKKECVAFVKEYKEKHGLNKKTKRTSGK